MLGDIYEQAAACGISGITALFTPMKLLIVVAYMSSDVSG